MRTPFIHKLLAAPLSGPEIEDRSFEAIDRQAQHSFATDEWEIVRRMIHTAGDLTLAEIARFSADAIPAGVKALREGRPLYVDANMIRAGLSPARLRSANPDYTTTKIFCHIADEDVARQAKQAGLPRSLFAIRKAKPMLHGGIVVFGNAPVALLELNRLIIEEGIRPALVLALPVGFVHVLESKEEFLALDIPHVALVGHRGGSALAVAAVHAFCTLAARKGGGAHSTQSLGKEIKP